MKVSEIVTDWVSRTLCPAWHVPVGEAPNVNEAANWLRQGLEWVDFGGRARAVEPPRIGTESCSIVDWREACNHLCVH